MNRNLPSPMAINAASFSTEIPWTSPEFSNVAFETVLKTYAGWLNQANRFRTEVSLFIGNRFEHDVEVMKKIGTCNKPEHFMRLQSEFISELISDYMQESKKLLDLLNEGMLLQIEKSDDAAKPVSKISRIH